MIWAWPTKLIYIIMIRVNSSISSNSNNNNHENSRQCKGSYILHKRINEPQKIMRTKLHWDEIWYSGNRAKTLYHISFKKITVPFAFYKTPFESKEVDFKFKRNCANTGEISSSVSFQVQTQTWTHCNDSRGVHLFVNQNKFSLELLIGIMCLYLARYSPTSVSPCSVFL